MDLGAALLHENAARGDELAAEPLDPEVLRPGITAVARGTNTLLVCHGSVLELHVGDFHFGKLLAVSGVAPVPGTAREPVNLDLRALPMAHHLGRHLRALQD